MRYWFTSLLLLLLVANTTLRADPPPGYYDSAQGKAGPELLTALHAIIRAHHIVPYASSAVFDTSDALAVLDQNPADTNEVLLIYNGSNALASTFALATGWNREHQWPNSYGLDDVQPAFSDLHNLRACDANVNSSRGNKYYDTTTTNGVGYSFPAHPEAPQCSTDFDSWEPRPEDRGNIARSLFYMATRYTGDVPGEPHLILTDQISLIQSTNAYMGRLSTLLAWHNADPVDATERQRNDLIYSLYQTNRNPFVDHPEWVSLTFAPPATNPPLLEITRTTAGVQLTWLATNQSSHLEFATNLVGDWFTVSEIPTMTNVHFLVAYTNDAPAAFFRLRTQ